MIKRYVNSYRYYEADVSWKNKAIKNKIAKYDFNMSTVDLVSAMNAIKCLQNAACNVYCM